MRYGHTEAQDMFSEMGSYLGYRVRRTWQKTSPTDGVWLANGSQLGAEELPLVALEVVVSEHPKSARGSIATLVEVSPALGVIVLHEEEMRGALMRRGSGIDTIERQVASLRSYIIRSIARTPQRIALWSFAQLRRRFELITGRYSLLRSGSSHN